jgi:hypothetical protein
MREKRFAPYVAWAKTYHSLFMLTFDGTSHVSYDETPCVQVATDTYLRTLTTPPAHTHCPAVLPSP